MGSVIPPPQQPLRLPSAAPSSATATAMILAVTVAALYLGREVLIPLALSILVSFALSPATTLLRRWGLGRMPSVLLVVVVVFALVAGFVTVVTSQVTGLTDNLARYEYNLRSKIRAVETFAQGGRHRSNGCRKSGKTFRRSWKTALEVLLVRAHPRQALPPEQANKRRFRSRCTSLRRSPSRSRASSRAAFSNRSRPPASSRSS